MSVFFFMLYDSPRVLVDLKSGKAKRLEPQDDIFDFWLFGQILRMKPNGSARIAMDSFEAVDEPPECLWITPPNTNGTWLASVVFGGQEVVHTALATARAMF